MGVVTRIADVVNANIHAVLDKAEKPEKMLRLVIQELEETLVDARSQAAKNIANKKMLTRKQEQLKSQVSDWLAKAETALLKEREDLAKQALIEKTKCEAELTEIEKALDALTANLAAMNGDISRLQQKLIEAKVKQKSFLQRQASATTQLKSKKLLNTYDMTEMEQRYESFARKVDEMESKVEAYETSSNPSLEQEFKQLEAESKLTNELEQLKAKVAKH
jgi:phage shock protein A